MKTITISTENSETYSSISNFFIDYYMTEANGEFVKVYLYLVRLLNNNSAITVAGIADHFNLTENDICRAIKYWISRDVLKLNYDGKGRLSGIVLLPLHAPLLDNRLDSDAISILHTDVEEEAQETPVSNVMSFTAKRKPAPSTEEAETETERTIPVKPKFTNTYVSSFNEDQDFSDILYQIETLFCKSLSASDTNTLIYIYDTLNFSTELLEYLIEYCASIEKKSVRYMETIALDWFQEGITTKQKAKERALMVSDITKIVFTSLGIKRTRPTNIELAFINTWSKDMGFSKELIKLACEKAVLASPNSATFPYVNGILENWSKNNVKSISDVETVDKLHAGRIAKEKAMEISRKTNKYAYQSNNSVASFEQKKLDSELDEMEQLLLKEVNNQ